MVVDEVLAGMDVECNAMHASSVRRSVPPEQLLKATVLMAMYSMWSERAQNVIGLGLANINTILLVCLISNLILGSLRLGTENSASDGGSTAP